MTYLIALVIAILIGGLIALLSFTNIGSTFSDRDAKGQAQKILNTAAEIQAAYTAREAIYGRIANVADENELIDDLKSKNLLRDRDFTEMSFGIEGIDTDTGQFFVNNTNEKVCQHINNQFNGVSIDTEIPTCENNTQNLACCID